MTISSQLHKPMAETSIIKINIFIILIGTFIRTSTNIYLARWLGVAEYGDITVACSVLELFTIVALLGSNASISQLFSVYVFQKDWSRAKAFIPTVLIFVLACSIMVIFLSLIILVAYEYWHHGKLVLIPQEIHLFFYGLWIIPIWAFAKIFNSFITSLHHAILAKFCQRLYRPFLCLGVFFLYVYFKKNMSAFAALWGFSFSIVAFSIVQFYYFIIMLPNDIKIHVHKR